MEQKEIPVNAPLYRNTPDEIANENYLVDRVNVLRDPMTGASFRMPGLVQFVDTGRTNAIQGAYYNANANKIYFMQNGYIYSLTSAAALDPAGATGYNSPATINDYAPLTYYSGQMNTANRPVFAAIDQAAVTPDIIFVANGGEVYFNKPSLVGTYFVKHTDAQAYSTITHPVSMDGFLLLNRYDYNTMQFTDPDDPLLIAADDFVSAEYEPDNIVAMARAKSLIYLVGSTCTEIWQNDGSTPFSRMLGMEVDEGTLSPNTVLNIEGNIAFFSRKKKLGYIAGNSFMPISGAYDSEFASLTTITDAFLMQFNPPGRSLAVLTFPTHNVSYCYDYLAKEWMGRIAEWNTTTAEFDRWRANCIVDVPEWNKIIVGGTDGVFYYVDKDTYQYGSDTLKSQITTGHIQRKTYGNTRCLKLIFHMKRGLASYSATTPKLMVEYRNENEGWKGYREVDIGNVGDYTSVVEVRRLGYYKSRQWRFTLTDNIGMTINKVIEVYD